MRIHHLIDGRPVESARYFETVNPATQEVLAEVAQGGADEVNAAVAAAKNAFPAWAGRPAPERARLMNRLADLIVFASSYYTLHAGDVILTGTPEGVGPIQPGDLIDASISGIGQMRVKVAS